MARRVTIRDKAWMAGVIETRGRLQRIDNSTRKTAQLRLVVRNRNLPVIQRLCALTGVEYRQYSAKFLEDAKRRSCVQHCPEPHVHSVNAFPAIFEWTLTGAAAAIVLFGLREYLCEPNKMTDFLDEVIVNLPTKGRGRHAILASVDRLAKLGWPIPPVLAAAAKPVTVPAAEEDP